VGRAPDASSDVGLVAAIGDGDHDALGEVYRRHGAAVWSIARRVCRDPGPAEEVCQAVFTELWSRPEGFDPARGDLRSWLVAQAHSRAVDATRAVRGPRGDEVALPAGELGEEARRALDQLPTPERDAILLAYLGGHSYVETAHRLGTPASTIKSCLRDGLRGLQRALEAEGVTR
jgi:RNA polymerase sigma-70 factor (ECF subfamily)